MIENTSRTIDHFLRETGIGTKMTASMSRDLLDNIATRGTGRSSVRIVLGMFAKIVGISGENLLDSIPSTIVDLDILTIWRATVLPTIEGSMTMSNIRDAARNASGIKTTDGLFRKIVTGISKMRIPTSAPSGSGM